MELQNKIYNLDVNSFLEGVPENSIDLIVTSPPYNVGIEYDSCSDNMEWSDYYKWCSDWLSQCFRVLKPDGRLCLNHYISLGTSKFRTSPISELNCISLGIGFKHHAIAVWTDITLAKKTAWGSYLSASAPYINSPFEGILIMYKDRWKKDNKGISDIGKDEFVKLTRGRWDIKPETRGLTKANFSVRFAESCIKLFSYQSSIVMDPFSGSGTVGVACVRNNRSYLLNDISPNYCKIAEDRISKESGSN